MDILRSLHGYLFHNFGSALACGFQFIGVILCDPKGGSNAKEDQEYLLVCELRDNHDPQR